MHLFRFTTARGSFLVALLALLALATAFGGQRSTAYAETYDLSAFQDICLAGGTSISVTVGDEVNITGTMPVNCEPVDLTPWSNLWAVEQFPNDGDPLYRVTITQPGSAAVDFGNGRELTINASAGLPGAPSIDEVVPGDGQATVYFSPPASDGGSPITGYTVTTEPGGQSTSGTGSPITITGLENGAIYTFTVAATNIHGTGPSSAPAEASLLPGADVGLAIVPSPSEHGQTVELRATVVGVDPTGSVEFEMDGATIGSVALDADGSATLETGPLELGTYTFRALYSGDSGHQPGDSGAVLHEVTAAGSSTTLTANFSHVLFGETVVLTAAVQTISGATGTVTFRVDGEVVGMADVELGVATLATSQFALGDNEISAEYSGDAFISGSVSETITVFVHEPAVEAPTQTQTPTPTPTDTPGPTELPTSTPTPTPTAAPTESVLTTAAPAGSTTLDIGSHGFRVGDVIRISPGLANEETRTITGLDPLTLDRPLEFDHPAGTGVVLSGALTPTATPTDETPTPGAGGATPIPPGTGSGAAGAGGGQSLILSLAVTCLLLGAGAVTWGRVRR